MHQSPPPPPPPPNQILYLSHNAKQRGYPKSDPGGDSYYVGCLGQTRVSLPEQLIIMKLKHGSYRGKSSLCLYALCLLKVQHTQSETGFLFFSFLRNLFDEELEQFKVVPFISEITSCLAEGYAREKSRGYQPSSQV